MASIKIYKGDDIVAGDQSGTLVSELDWSSPVDSGFLIIPETGTESVIGEWKKCAIRCNEGLQTILDLGRNCRLTLEGLKSTCWQLTSDNNGSPSDTPSDWGQPLDIVSDKIYEKNYIFHIRACTDVGDIVENDKTTKLVAQALVGLPWILDIDDMLAEPDVNQVSSNIFTIPEDCIIYTLNVDETLLPGGLFYIVNGESIMIYGPVDGSGFMWIHQALSVSKNSTFQINISGFLGAEAEGNLKLFLNNENGKELAYFYWHVNASCYLTTACVQYKGLDDNCAELTAMRLLREHYIDDLEYRNLISEYYQLASQIIEAINAEDDPSLVYEQIYQSVKVCESAVNNSDWQTARDEYLEMYYELAETYIPNYVRLMPL